MTTTINTDLLTPLAAYLRLRDAGRASFILESVERGRLGRNSWMGAGSRIVDFDEATELGLPIVGYLAYDHVARLEPTVPLPEDGRGFPESRVIVCDTLVRFDHGAGIAEVLAGDPEEIAGRLEAGIAWRREPRGTSGPIRRSPDRDRYIEMVESVKEHIVAGDVFQCVPSQRAERPTSATPLDIYRALRRVNPSPYLFLLELDGIALVGSSPERLVACENGRASLCPIAGTTEPTEGDVERLLSSEKDRAEHVMLVDLGRNDLSRVCKAGTVHVARDMEVERFSHVSHLVSEVVGELRDGVTPFEVLRACFPAGTVSGAPEGARDAADLRARRVPPWPVRRRRAVLPTGWDDGRLHRVAHDGDRRRRRLPAGGRRRRRRLRPCGRARGVPEEARRARGSDRSRGGGVRAVRLLMIDNYDSFTYNLVHLFEELGAEVVTVRNDAITVDEARDGGFDRLVVSPGPGRPETAGVSIELIRALGPTVPTLGVCLGHQAIVEAFGGTVGQAKALLHGKASMISHDGLGVYAELPADVEVGRYHSLAALEVPAELTVTSHTPDGEVMGVRHRELPIEGVQFHPESVLTPLGPAMARNFLR